MAITFVAAGALAASATAATIGVVAPTGIQTNDILIAFLTNKNDETNVISAPDGTWTEIYQADHATGTDSQDQRYAAFWKRSTDGAADSGATFNFTKATDENFCFAGVIGVWRGAKTSGSPLDATAVGITETTSAADNVTFPAFDPTASNVHVIFVAHYANDGTTFAAAMSNDTNPDCTTRFDLETNLGTDCTIAVTSGDNDGSNIASRTWASAAGVDTANVGVVFALEVAAPPSEVELMASRQCIVVG